MRRFSADWMVLWDERALEILAEEGTCTPKRIAEQPNIHVSRAHISNRLSTLSDNGLTDHLGNGVYKITREGRYYLAGGYDVQKEDYLHNIDPDLAVRNYESAIIELKTVIDEAPELKDKMGVFSKIRDHTDIDIFSTDSTEEPSS